MAYTYCMTSNCAPADACMTSNCAPADACARDEDDAGRHLLTRTYADFNEELIRKPDSTAARPFFIPKGNAQQTQH